MVSCTARPGKIWWILKSCHLTSETRLDTLDALDELKELSSAEELKNKLLFSVVVVSITCFLNFQ